MPRRSSPRSRGARRSNGIERGPPERGPWSWSGDDSRGDGRARADRRGRRRASAFGGGRPASFEVGRAEGATRHRTARWSILGTRTVPRSPDWPDFNRIRGHGLLQLHVSTPIPALVDHRWAGTREMDPSSRSGGSRPAAADGRGRRVAAVAAGGRGIIRMPVCRMTHGPGGFRTRTPSGTRTHGSGGTRTRGPSGTGQAAPGPAGQAAPGPAGHGLGPGQVGCAERRPIQAPSHRTAPGATIHA